MRASTHLQPSAPSRVADRKNLETMDSIVIEYRPDAYPMVEAALSAALAEDEGGAPIVLDLDSLDSLDTDGVRGLITLLRRARAEGRDLALSATKPAIRRTLQVTALDRLFGMVEAEPA